MTPEQFIFWMRGFLSGYALDSTVAIPASVLAQALAQVVASPTPAKPAPLWEKAQWPANPTITCGTLPEGY